MLGKIISIEENTVTVGLAIDITNSPSIINMLVSMKDTTSEFIGEVCDVNKDTTTINLLGEIIDGKFVSGVLRKPSFSSVVTMVPKENVKDMISIGDYVDDRDLYIGKSTVYNGVDVCININDFFANHFAIFGSSGSGKSCSVARIFQNLFNKKTKTPSQASIFMFDAYGEYHTAFKSLGEINPKLNFKAYTTNVNENSIEKMCIPPWLLSLDDYSLLLGATSHSQLPILEKALKLVTIFAKEEEQVIKIKNDIIARALIDVLSSGKSASQIRDQIISVLSYYYTQQLNLESIIETPGYNRPLKQCFNIEPNGKLREMELLTNFFQSFLNHDYELRIPDGTFKYTLKDLSLALDFALISEGVLKSDKVFDETNILKVRLNSLINSNESVYFDYKEYISREDYIKKLATTSDGKRAQIINFNINYIDDRLAKTITKIYSKMLFDFSKDTKNRVDYPFHIVLEEAHRYVQNDNDIFLLGYNIFERIAKEGRKYGVILGFISQRPSELSETAISQCSNFLIFKMTHPKDVGYIKEMIPSVTEEVIKKLKILQPGNCIAFGSGFKVPVLIKMDMPNPRPSSSSCDVSNKWFNESVDTPLVNGLVNNGKVVEPHQQVIQQSVQQQVVPSTPLVQQVQPVHQVVQQNVTPAINGVVNVQQPINVVQVNQNIGQ